MATFTKLINTPATINATISGGVTSHVWKIDEVTQPETTSSITRTYSTPGTHIIRHEGTNLCGECAAPVEHTLIISETLPETGSKSMYYMMGAALLGFLMMKKK